MEPEMEKYLVSWKIGDKFVFLNDFKIVFAQLFDVLPVYENTGLNLDTG